VHITSTCLPDLASLVCVVHIYNYTVYSMNTNTTQRMNAYDGRDIIAAKDESNKLAFLSMPAPASYVAGLGRG
jgi:hypothetical protein